MAIVVVSAAIGFIRQQVIGNTESIAKIEARMDRHLEKGHL